MIWADVEPGCVVKIEGVQVRKVSRSFGAVGDELVPFNQSQTIDTETDSQETKTQGKLFHELPE